MKRVEYGKGAPQHIHKYKSKEFKGLFHCIIVVKVLLISEHNKGSHLVRGRYSQDRERWERKKRRDKHNAELQRTDPGTKNTGEFSTRGHNFPPNV